MAFLSLLARPLRQFLAILMVLALAGAPPAGHHHHHHKADCTACCCDCLGSAALALPESGFEPVRAEAAAAYGGVSSMRPGRAPQPEPDPPRLLAPS